MHSIQHAPNDIARWGDTDNMDVEAAELAHKNWIKQQGGKNQSRPSCTKEHDDTYSEERGQRSVLRSSSRCVLHYMHNMHNIHNIHKHHKMHNILFCNVQHESRTAIMDMNLTNGKHATVELDSQNH